MIKIAERLSQVKPSVMMQVSMAARKLRADGVDVLDLGMGEPDFDTPRPIIDAAHAAALAGDTHYTPTQGTAALRQAVVRKFATENGLTYTPDQILIAAGAKQVIFDAMAATVEPGDEVIIPAPYWGTYLDIVLMFGGTPVPVACPAEDDFLLSPAALAAAITPQTRWLFLNSPSNPSGAMLDVAQMQALGQVLRDHPQVMVLSDEIYEHILYDGRRFTSFAAACPDLADRVLVVNGVSKAYAMTGWRIGYAAGPEALIKAMITVQSQATSGPSSVSQAAAVAALSGPQDVVETFRQAFQARRDLVVSRLAQVPGLTIAPPPGAFYAYVGCQALLGRRTAQGDVLTSDADVVQYLLTTGRVAVVPGAAFGLSPFFRISLASSTEVLTAACDRIQQAVAQLC
ncbi:MAG TPA: pyridoxal phosphate-dependent aminotransferase [Paenirhodobacter sp.]